MWFVPHHFSGYLCCYGIRYFILRRFELNVYLLVITFDPLPP